jgi:hypothetical protein
MSSHSPVRQSQDAMEHRHPLRRNSRVATILESTDDLRDIETHAVDWKLPITHHKYFVTTAECQSPTDETYECHPPSPLLHELIQETPQDVSPSGKVHVSWPIEAQMPHYVHGVHCARRAPVSEIESPPISCTKSRDDCYVPSEVHRRGTPVLSMAHPRRPHHSACEAVGYMPPMWYSWESESPISE